MTTDDIGINRTGIGAAIVRSIRTCPLYSSQVVAVLHLIMTVDFTLLLELFQHIFHINRTQLRHLWRLPTGTYETVVCPRPTRFITSESIESYA